MKLRFKDLKVGMYLKRNVGPIYIPWIGIVDSINKETKQVTITWESNAEHSETYTEIFYEHIFKEKKISIYKERKFDEDIKNLLDS